MKKNIGTGVCALPHAAAAGGGSHGGRQADYVLVGHLGIIGHYRIMVSLAAPHFTNRGIKETGALSVRRSWRRRLRRPTTWAS